MRVWNQCSELGMRIDGLCPSPNQTGQQWRRKPNCSPLMILQWQFLLSTSERIFMFLVQFFYRHDVNFSRDAVRWRKNSNFDLLPTMNFWCFRLQLSGKRKNYLRVSPAFEVFPSFTRETGIPQRFAFPLHIKIMNDKPQKGGRDKFEGEIERTKAGLGEQFFFPLSSCN